MARGRQLDDALALARWPVVRKERDPREGEHRVATHEANLALLRRRVKAGFAALVIRKASRYSPAPMRSREPAAGVVS
jgi:hypothetical protein